MAKYKFQKGKLYKIRFHDHCVGIKDTMQCEVVGWVLDDNDLRVVLTHWIVDTKDEDMKALNVEYTTLAKSCIIRVRKLL